MSCFFAFPFWIFQDETQVEPWIEAVKWTLYQESFFGGKSISKNVREELLSEEDADDFDFEEIGDQDDSWILQGVPRRPLYKELAYRLFRWSKRGCTGDQLFLPAERLNFKDEAFLAMLPPNKPQNFLQWLHEFGDMGILHVLGKRQTMGTDQSFLMPPSRKALLLSANLPHKPPNALTVAARARSKHAHRGQDQFFGIATGSQETQNIETREVLVNLLEEAVWVNIHTFGGMEGNPMVEIRVKSGYGARWTVDWSSYSPKNVEFRGFLEPQTEDGHEMGWKHGDEEYMAEQQKQVSKEGIPSISVARAISAEAPSETKLVPPSTTAGEEQAPLSEKATADPYVEQGKSEQVDLAEMDEPKLDTVPVEETPPAADVPSEPAAEEVQVQSFEDQPSADVAVEQQDEVRPLLSEKAKRKVMIKEELAKIIKETEENELEEELEPEAVAALEKAAMIVAYRKKYYDVFKDEFIYFPTVTATFLNYALIEEAEKYYYDEDDEFPMNYSAALRSVAGMSAADNEDDADEDYMERLAMDVDIGEDAEVPETIKDEEVQDVLGAEEEANQDDKAQQGTEEWVKIDDKGTKLEEKTPEVASSLQVPEEKEIPTEAPSPTIDTTEPAPKVFAEKAYIIDEAKSENFVVVDDEELPKEDDGNMVEISEPPIAEESERLAMDVDIGEDTSPVEQIPEPKEGQATPTQEEWPESNEPEPVIEEDWPEPAVVEEEPEPEVDDEEPTPVVEDDEPVVEESDQEYILVEEENERSDEVVSDPTFEEEVPEQVVTEQVVTEEEPPKTDESEPLSEKAKRKVMIKEELAKIIKETEENELEEELEPEAVAALEKAAMIVAYRKKYYDVFKDEFIYFPTVTATFLNYALIEEAEKYYYDEDDEFPMNYSAALRSVAGMSAADNDDDADEDYMERLAMDVDIGEEDTEQ
jgi:hypothetical protein